VKLSEKIEDSIFGVKLKSGTNIEIHVVKHDNGNQSLVIEKPEDGNQRLLLPQQDILDFLALLNDFLKNV
jgi:hypothetical protein